MLLDNSRNLGVIRPYVFEHLVRIGNVGDGGYVIPLEVSENIESLYSLGLGENWSFESEISKINPKIEIKTFDHTVNLQFFIILVAKGIAKFILFRCDIKEVVKRFKKFQLYLDFWVSNKNNTHYKIKISRDNIAELLSECAFKKMALKIDIEGDEYSCLQTIKDQISQLELLIVEFHDVGKNYLAFSELLSNLKNDFNIAHIHANNFEGITNLGLPQVLEMTFVNKRYEHRGELRVRLPLENLDFPCAKNREDFHIIF
jgi:hypothetical protein